MATFTKFNAFVEAIAEKKHDLGSDQLVVALTSTEPSASDDSVKTDLPTEISYTNCSTRNLTTASSSQTAGTYTLDITDLTLTASGGDVGPFQYVTIYNDTATNDDLLCYFDVGSATTITDGADFDITFDASGLLTIA